MTKRTRTSEWDRYRKRERLSGRLTETRSLGNDKKDFKDGKRSSFLSTKSDALRKKEREKVIEIKNSAAPLSIPERHYPKEFSIKKPEGEE